MIINPYLFGGAGPTDPNFSYLVAGLHFDGPNGSTTFTDITGRSWAVLSPGTAAISTAQSKFGGASLLPATWGINTPQTTDILLGANDFTIRFWLYLNALGVYYVMCKGPQGGINPYLFFANNDVISFLASTNGGASWNVAPTSAASTLTTGTQKFISISRIGSDWRLHVDGTLAASASNAGTVYDDGGSSLALGSSNGSSAFVIDGYIDDFQIYDGIGIYNGSNYTPPTAAFPNS